MKAKVIIILAIITIFIIAHQCEPFATKREKATTIFNWFNENPKHNYSSYRDDVRPSNIVEYEDTLGLYKKKNFTIDAIERVL